VYTARYGLGLLSIVQDIADAFSRRHRTAESLVRSQVSPCEICVGKIGTGTKFSLSTSGFPVVIPSIHEGSLSVCYSYQRDKRAKPGNLPKSNALSEVRERWVERYFYFLFPSPKARHSEPAFCPHTVFMRFVKLSYKTCHFHQLN
jgi:hypothetical protein